MNKIKIAVIASILVVIFIAVMFIGKSDKVAYSVKDYTNNTAFSIKLSPNKLKDKDSIIEGLDKLISKINFTTESHSIISKNSIIMIVLRSEENKISITVDNDNLLIEIRDHDDLPLHVIDNVTNETYDIDLPYECVEDGKTMRVMLEPLLDTYNYQDVFERYEFLEREDGTYEISSSEDTEGNVIFYVLDKDNGTMEVNKFNPNEEFTE